MPVARREVDDHPAPDEVQPPAVAHGELLDVAAYLAGAGSCGREAVHVYLDVYPARVRQDRAVGHPLEVRGRQHVRAPRGRDEDLPYPGRLQGRQHVEPVGVGFEAAHGVYLADGDAGA